MIEGYTPVDVELSDERLDEMIRRGYLRVNPEGGYVMTEAGSERIGAFIAMHESVKPREGGHRERAL